MFIHLDFQTVSLVCILMSTYGWVYYLGLLLANYFNYWVVNTIKILSWNVSGGARKGFKHQLKLLIHSHDLNFLILMEINKIALSVISSLKFPNFKIIPSLRIF